MKFLHLSDLHFHQAEKDNIEATDMLNFVQHMYPTHNLIITGDIVDDGHADHYDLAAKALKPFDGRIFICPGNHDYGAAGNFYSLERAKRFDEYLSIPLHQGGTFTGDRTPVVNVLKDADASVMLIALNTNLNTEHPFDFACAAVGEDQLAALHTILSARSAVAMTKILFFHHHPFMHTDPFMRLLDGRELFRCIYAKVDIILFGHRHVMEEWNNMNRLRLVLASDSSPGKDYAREITVEGDLIQVAKVRIKP
jgi:3',5'-cyclic AMP phosphodiesterase CpdA